MNGQTTHTFDFGQLSPVRYFVLVAVVLGLLFAMIGGAEDRSLLLVMLHWQLQTLIPIALLIGAHMALSHSLVFDRLGPWLQLLISGVIGVLIFAPLALWIDWTVGGENTGTKSVGWQLLDELSGMGPPVVLSWLAMNAPWVMGYRVVLSEQDSAADEVSDQVSQPGTDHQMMDADQATQLQTLIPAAIRAPIMYLKSELHYLHVQISKGSALVLYNLKDAVAEMPAKEGVQPHRSYWVSWSFVTHGQRQGRQGVLKLSDGTTVPVSRQQLSAVMTACQDRDKTVH